MQGDAGMLAMHKVASELVSKLRMPPFLAFAAMMYILCSDEEHDEREFVKVYLEAYMRTPWHEPDLDSENNPIEKTVLITDTTPLAGLMPDTHYPRVQAKPKVNDFVFSDELDGLITAGLVTMVNADEYAIHQYWPSASYTHWQPVWVLPNGKLDRKKVAPAGAEAKLIHFGYDRTIAIGSIGDNALLSSNLMKELAAQELLNPGDSKSEVTQTASGQSTISAQAASTGPANAHHTIEMCYMDDDFTSDDDCLC